jgi:urease accessory protein
MPPPRITTITTTRTITITEPAALLRLLAWLSPAFPTGGYAWSHGVEWAVETGDITNTATLRVWLEDILRHGAGRTDAILLRHAHRAAADIAALNSLAALARALAPSRELLAETTAQGNAFRAAAAAWNPEILNRIEADLPYPIAVGALAGAQGIAENDAALGVLQAFAANLISAAVRLVPLGQSAGLAVLAALEPTITGISAETQSAGLDDIGSLSWRADIAAMRHETQYTRLFRS